MNSIELKNNLKKGELVLGTLIVSASPFWLKILENCSLDFIFIDTEHIALNRVDLSWMCRSYSAIGYPPLVRMPSPDPYIATQYLDDGASGVIAPYVEKIEQVRELIGATKKRPIKGKRLEELIKNNNTEQKLDEYISEFNKQNLLILNIESTPAIDNLDSILENPGIDAIQIGPHDLTSSLGIPEEYENIIYLNTVEKIFKKARSKSVGAGIHAWGEPKYQKRLIDMGANMIIHKADAIFFQQSLNKEIKEIRDLVGVEQNKESGKIQI